MHDTDPFLNDRRMLCFDNDGTLFASHEVANPAIQRSYVSFCRIHGLTVAPPSDDEICRLTGKPGPEFYREILPSSLQDLAPRFREVCLDEEVREVLARGRFYPGMEELLAELRNRGRLVVLVTNAGERYLGAVSRRLDYSRHLDGIYHYGKDELWTKAEMLRAAMRDFGRTDAVMIGDRASDLEGARRAEIPFIGCLYGYGTAAELSGADRLVHSVEELAELLLDVP